MTIMVGHDYLVGYKIGQTTDASGNTLYSVGNFGVGTRVSTLSGTNNVERVWVLGQRTPGALVPLKWEGSWGIETNPTTLQVLLDWGIDSRDAPVMKNIEIYQSNGAIIGELLDAVVQRATLTARQGEMVRLTFDGIYKQNSYPSASVSSPTNESGTPLIFSDGSVSLSGITNGIIQSFEVSINMNADPIYGLGSRFFKDVVLKQFEAEGRITIAMDQSEYKSFVQSYLLESDSDSLSDIDIILSFTNGENIKLSVSKLNELSHSIEPNEVVIVDAVFYASDVTVTTTTGA